MKRRAIVLTALLAAGLLAHATYGDGPGPPGVDAERWIALGEHAGVVVEEGPSRSVGGTLYVRIDGVWRVVSLRSEPRVIPLGR